MKRIKKEFGYKKESGQNPYTGFMSFQHFRGEKMYSDIVVRPEANRTETERVECYPVSADAEENGRAEGYYPDTRLAYIRVLWKEFEPERGKYNFKFIEDILNEARTHGQSLIFRLMAHSTRKEDDVPEWLKALIPCPERPDGERIKDSPTDPMFLELFLKAVKALGEKFDESPEFYAIDISLPGAWGEGYKLELYPDNVLEVIVDTYTSVFKNTQLLTQLARPNLIKYARESAGVDLGWRGDGLGSPEHIYELYPPMIEKIPDNWKSAPVSFESYWWLGEWERQGWDIDEIIEKTLSWHISSFNGKSMPAPEAWRDRIDYWVSRMGYHFTLNFVDCPNEVRAGEELSFKLSAENVGVAPVYKPAGIFFRLVSGGAEYSFAANTDVRTLLPGKHGINVTSPIPRTLPAGKYSLEIKMQFKNGEAIYLATDAEPNGDHYKLAEINITV